MKKQTIVKISLLYFLPEVPEVISMLLCTAAQSLAEAGSLLYIHALSGARQGEIFLIKVLKVCSFPS